MKRAIAIIALITAILPAFAKSGQRHYTVALTEQGSGRPLADISVQILDGSGSLKSFTVTDGDGLASFEADEGDSIVCSFLGYQNVSSAVSDMRPDSTTTFEMTPSSVTLREVTVKAPPLRARNDTIVYSVDAFRSKDDRYLEDVLKKLPGITVGQNGAISYQGQPIKNFYIEGQDLLGNGYAQASRNFPVDAVREVEVLEHNQNIKALKDKVFEERAALNIRLDKKHRGRPFGQAEAGAGFSPALWTGKLFLASVSAQRQTLVNAKGNNTGTDLSPEIGENIEIADIASFLMLPAPFRQAARTRFNIIPDERTLDNRGWLATVNHLEKINTFSTLRVNLSGYRDAPEEKSVFEYTYGGLSSTSYWEENKSGYSSLTVKPRIKYELNSDNTFISDELTYSYTRNRQSRLLMLESEDISQRILSNPQWIQNKFSSVFTADGLIFTASSNTRLYKEPQYLLAPSADNQIRQNEFITLNSITTSFPLFSNMAGIGIHANHTSSRYHAGSKSMVTEYEAGISLNYQFRYSSGTLSLDCPVIWTRASLHSAKTRDSRTYISPRPVLSLRHKLLRDLDITARASYSKERDGIPFFADDTIAQDYRILYKSPDSLSFINSVRTSLAFNYHNLARMFFTSLSASFMRRTSGCYADHIYMPASTIVSYIMRENSRNSYFLNFSADKTFVDAGLDVKFEASWSGVGYLIAQNGLLAENTSNSANTSLNLIFQKLRWMTGAVESSAAITWQHNCAESSSPLHFYRTKASVSVFPFTPLTAKIAFDSFANEVEPSRYKWCCFLDADISYKLTERVSFEFEAKNILGNKSYSYTSETGVNRIFSAIPLRGREFLFKTSWTF